MTNSGKLNSYYYKMCNWRGKWYLTFVKRLLVDNFITAIFIQMTSAASDCKSRTALSKKSKEYDSPTCVTRLKVAPNKTDPISLKGTSGFS